MKNDGPIIDALCLRPEVGQVIDQEPYPIGEVVEAVMSNATLKHVLVTMRLTNRNTGEQDLPTRRVFFAVLDTGEMVPIASMPAGGTDGDNG